MTLQIQDIQKLHTGNIILYACPKMGWAKARITDMGLNYCQMVGLEGSKMDQIWKHDIYFMMSPDQYKVYIPPPQKKMPWFRWWLRQILIRWAKKLSRQ